MSTQLGTPLAAPLPQSGPDLPPEILGHCFQHLPFVDRFGAARVSRYWRACALSFPSLWADIHLLAAVSTPSLLALLELALSRSALYPVDFECCVIFDMQDAIVQLLSAHMHHLRSIVWFGGIDSPGFTSPAPMLERYVWRSSKPIPEDLLGGQAGELRHVDLARPILPDVCPAFARVTHLTVEVPGSEDAPSLSRLFLIFPRLVSLTLTGLPSDNQHIHLLGRVPRTLTRLVLQTERANCDLGQYVFELAPPLECKDVRLSLPMKGSSLLASLLDGARELAIVTRHEDGQPDELAPIVIALPAERMLTLEFESPADVHTVSNVIVAGLLARAGLAQLRVLTMPLYTVQRFFRAQPALPSLSELCILIPQAGLTFQSSILDLIRLYCLEFLRPYALSCCTLEATTCLPPSTGDAAALFEYIAQYGQVGVRYVLRGFPSNVADAVPVPVKSGFDIQFDSAGPGPSRNKGRSS